MNGDPDNRELNLRIAALERRVERLNRAVGVLIALLISAVALWFLHWYSSDMSAYRNKQIVDFVARGLLPLVLFFTVVAAGILGLLTWCLNRTSNDKITPPNRGTRPH